MPEASPAASSSSALPPPSYEERCRAVNVISQPLASRKITKKAHKLVHKAARQKRLRRGVKEVVKALRKGETGLALLAGDIYPLDVIAHLPVLLEEHNVPYLFVPSKFDLGAAASTKRPTSCVLVRTTAEKSSGGDAAAAALEGQELFEELVKEAKAFDPTTIQK